jgi:hypothetical protein
LPSRISYWPGLHRAATAGVRPMSTCRHGICLDTHMLCGVYQESGICVRNHCGAQPPRDIEPPGLVTTVRWRARTSTSDAAAHGVKTPAGAARGRFRGIHGGRATPSLPAETCAASGSGCLVGAVPPILVRSRRCSRTPSGPHESLNANEHNTNEKEDKEKKMTDREQYAPGFRQRRGGQLKLPT